MQLCGAAPRALLGLLAVLPACAASSAGHGAPHTRDGRYFEFRTRPDIEAPVWDIHVYNEKALAPGYWFIAPYEIVTQQSPGRAWVGPHVYDTAGELIWSGTPAFGHWNIFDFGVSNVDGEPHLSMLDWHKQRGAILDNSYRIRKSVPMLADGDTFQNMHAFQVVDDGKTALVLSDRSANTASDTSLGINGTCHVRWEGFRALDLRSPTAEPLFRWDPRDYIGLNESTYRKYDGSAAAMCDRGWDLMHSNSIDKFSDGDYLLSARHTDAIYRISHVDGSIVWRLGGVMSDFKLGDNVLFSRQHHARVREHNSTHTIVSLFDNAVGEHFKPQTRSYSRGLVLSLDLKQMTAEVLMQYDHPKRQLTDGRGSLQMLPNGNAFVDWAVGSLISEHTPNGSVAMEAVLPAKIDTYRAFKHPWVGRPHQPPDVHSEVEWKNDIPSTVISMSWNGATEVARWNVSGTDTDGNPIHIASVKRIGFETTVSYDDLIINVHAEALDRNGNLLGMGGSGGTWSSYAETESPGKADHSKFISFGILLGLAVCLGVLIAAFVLAYRCFRSRRQRKLVKDRGEYQMVGQNEDR